MLGMFNAGADLDAVTAKNWTPLSYAKAKGKYGATEEKGIYPEVSKEMAVSDTHRHICSNIAINCHQLRS